MAKRGRNPIKNKPTKNKNYVGNKIFKRGDGLAPPPRLNIATESLLSNYSYNEIISFSRYLYFNSGVVKGSIDLLSIYSTSNAFKIKSLIDDSNVAAIYNNYINAIIKNFTIKGESMDEFLFDASTCLAVDGDFFVNLTFSNLTKYPKIQLITADRVKGDKNDVKGTKFASSEFNVNRGIITNATGFEVAYIIDGQIITSQSILHIKQSNPYGGVRGIPLFSHAIRELKYLEQIQQSELHATKIASSFALVETNESGNEGYDTDNEDYSSDVGKAPTEYTEFQSGKILMLKAGDGSSIDTLKFERPSPNYQAFEARLIDAALLGAGIPNLHEKATSANVRSNLQIFDRVVNDNYLILKKMIISILEYMLAYGIQSEKLPYSEQWDKLLITTPIKPSIDLGRTQKSDLELYNQGLKLIDDFIPSDMTVEQFIQEQANQQVMREIALEKARKNLIN